MTGCGAAATSGRILVVFDRFGGNDGLNTIVPYGDPMYYKHRPTIGIKEKARLAQVDARHEAPVRRRQSGHRSRRRLRPAVVLALHLDIVHAHRGAQQRQRVRLDWPHRVGDRPGRARDNLIVNISDSQTLAVNRISGYLGWQQAARKLMPTPRQAAQLDLTAMVVESGASTPEYQIA